MCGIIRRLSATILRPRHQTVMSPLKEITRDY